MIGCGTGDVDENAKWRVIYGGAIGPGVWGEEIGDGHMVRSDGSE